MVMGSEQGFAADVIADILHHGAGNAHAVKGRCAAADLIQNDQAALGGPLQNFGHFGHFHHKGGLTGGKVIRCAHAGKDSIHHTDMAAGCRNKAADLRHQGNQRILAHVGRFARHVGAGDDEHAVFGFVQRGIVWHKQTAFQHLLNHRVAALGNRKHIAVIHRGFYIVVLHRRFRKGSQNIQLGYRKGRALDAQQLGGDGFQQVGKQLVFQYQQALVCAKDLVFQLFQFRGNVALPCCQGLLADKGIRYAGRIAAADLNIVAEHFIETYFQLGDAGLLFQLGFQLGKEALAAVHDIPQLVHFGVEPCADGTAVLKVCRGIFHQGTVDEVQQIFQRVHSARKLLQQWGGTLPGQLAYLRQINTGIPQGFDLLGGGGAIQNAGGQAFNVINMGERFF